MKVLIVVDCKNQNDRVKDATGAFLPEAAAFEKYTRAVLGAGDVFRVEFPGDGKNPGARARDFLRRLDASKARDFDALAFFGHGTPGALPGAGIYAGQSSYLDFVEWIRSRTTALHTIALYACSTGQDPIKGFAASLSNTLGVTVFSHRTAGHTTFNPAIRTFHVRRFEGAGAAVEQSVYEFYPGEVIPDSRGTFFPRIGDDGERETVPSAAIKAMRAAFAGTKSVLRFAAPFLPRWYDLGMV